MKYEAMEENRKDYPIELMCAVFGVSKSGYYEWRSMAEKRRSREADKFKSIRTMEAIHIGSKKKYGSPRVSDRMVGLGFNLSESTVARRMREFKIRSLLKRKFKVTTDSNHKLPVAPNLLMQDFSAQRRDQIWMSDITYIETSEGWLYVCAVLDLFSRRIVGWAASHRMTTDLVIAAYLRAKRARRPGKWLIFHSDRGSQYASHRFRKMLLKHEVLQSMSRRANCWDSAPIESFWARLKTECVYWVKFATRQAALQVISDWIENDYNVDRAHSAIGNMAPAEFERKMEVELKQEIL